MSEDPRVRGGGGVSGKKKKVEEDRPKLTEEEVQNIKRPLRGLRRLPVYKPSKNS